MTSLPLLQKLKRVRALLILLTLAAALFLSGLGAYRDFVRAESYFALGARLMLLEGDWLTPHAPDEPVLNKPPLQYWLTGVAYKIFGAGYATARLPSALAALCVLIAVYLLGARLYDNRAALLAASILTTSYLFYTFARTAMSDMLLTLSVTCALSLSILALTGKEEGRSRLLSLASYVFIALGVLAKGPVAIVLVAAPLFLELLFSRDPLVLKRLRILHGAAIVLAIAAPYFLLLYLKLGPEPLRAFFIGENLQRFTGGIYAYATRPAWYLPLALLSDFAPWSLLLVPAIYFDWRERGLEREELRARRLLYFWLFFPLVFFSFSHFKLDYYLLPAMPAAALIVGRFIALAPQTLRWPRIIIYCFVILFALVMTFAPVISARFAVALHLNASFGWPLAAMAGCALLFILHSLYRGRLCRAVWALVFSIWLALIVHEWTLAPLLQRYQPIASLAASIPAETETRIYTSRAASDWADTLSFHLPPGRIVTRLASDTNGEQLKEILSHDSAAVVLLKEEEFGRLQSSGPSLRTLAEGETLEHGGLSLDLLRNPKLEHLRLVQAASAASDR